MDLVSNMTSIGKRYPFQFNYRAGVDSNGKLSAIEILFYVNQGAYFDTADGSVGAALFAIDNVYSCPNWKVSGKICKTNIPPNTSTRGPGWVPAISCIEHIMQHLSLALSVPVDTLKQLNFYQKGSVTPFGQKLPDFPIETLWRQIQTQSNYAQRLEQVNQYNSKNRWTKRGITLQPLRFGVYWAGVRFGALVNVYGDGTVSISHGGIEIGQGINTKVAQAAAMVFAIALDKIKIYSSGTETVANSNGTGGSTTSELCVLATIDACNQIKVPLFLKFDFSNCLIACGGKKTT